MSDDDLDVVTERIVAVWRDIFGLPDLDADSHLLDLGANSLTAVKIRSRIRAEFGREVELIEFLDHPTPRELAPVVAAAPEWDDAQGWGDLDWSAEPAPAEDAR
ncbi:acyl carrier protein [Dactylosporangium roseum]|uniref:Acyl carrier protein n=1 Tax=Dactylosporangium roseum TaxID=47989 RepID=A0ABY5ZCX0_9ACTN|nr:acyl carrier protein [Dactylosporangium roseum]UWZ39421.1 acyl carrier protein [Dactylosporangium roseum]